MVSFVSKLQVISEMFILVKQILQNFLTYGRIRIKKVKMVVQHNYIENG